MAAVLGDLADAVVVRGVQAAVSSLVLLKEQDAGRAALVVAGDGLSSPHESRGTAPVGVWLRERVRCDDALRSVVERLLDGAVLVETVDVAAQQTQLHPALVFVTPAGDVFSRDVVHGGSQSTLSLLEVQAAYDETEAALQQAVHSAERARFDMVAAKSIQEAAAAAVEQALAGFMNQMRAWLQLQSSWVS